MANEWTNMIGRLLTDATLRRRLRKNPEEAAEALALTPDQVGPLATLDWDALEVQAGTLIRKRCHEVSKLMPRTMGRLGDDAFAWFHEHADSYWPRGHRRHMMDATAFGQFLLTRHAAVCRSELNRTAFAAYGKLFRIHWVSDAIVNGRYRRAIQLLYRRRRGPHELFIYLGP